MCRKLVTLLLVSLMTVSTFGAELQPNQTDQTAQSVIAFPGAEGGGMYTSGGRGCEVYIVDTLADYDPKTEEPIKGSLRDAVSQDNRMIVFNVSGTIELKTTMDLRKRKNLTIAGQSAPGDGITLSGWETNMSDAQNIIIRYIRFRPGVKNVHQGDSMDAIWGRSMKDIMIDHISTSWSTDETMSLYRAENMTVQWSVVNESLTMSGHTKGRHGYGGIWGGVNTTYHHNLISSHTSRVPRIGGGTVEADDNEHIANVQLSNNIIYNWGFNNTYGGGRADVNFINNYIKPGLGTRESVKKRVIDAGESKKPGRFYVSGNYLEGDEAITKENSLGTYISTANAETTQVVDAPFEMEGTKRENLNLQTAQAAYEEVLDKAGAIYPRRDAQDARVIQEVRDGLGRFINNEHEVGGYPVTTSEERDESFDKDRDGIADAWEKAHGLNPNDYEDNKKLAADGSGYTNLEVYLNSLVDMDYAPKNPVCSLQNMKQNQIYTLGETVSIEAEATDKDGIAYVAFYNGSKVVGKAEKVPYTYTLENLQDGTYYLSAKAFDKKGNATQSTAYCIHVNTPFKSEKWQSVDIGTPAIKGNTSINEQTGAITVKGAGKLEGKKDTCQYLYQQLTGDGTLIAKINSVTSVDNHAFAGIMFRESLEADAPTVALGLSQVKSTSYKQKDETTGKNITYYRNPWAIYLAGRANKGENFDKIGETLDSADNAKKANIDLQTDIHFKEQENYLGYYLKLVRKGDTFTAFSSPDGREWTQVGQRDVKMASTIYVGLAVEANQVDNALHNLNAVQFEQVKISLNK